VHVGDNANVGAVRLSAFSFLLYAFCPFVQSCRISARTDKTLSVMVIIINFAAKYLSYPMHPNANKSSNLLRLSAVLTVVGYFLFSNRGSMDMDATLLSIILLMGAAYLVRNGYSWVRWALLALLLLSIAAAAVALPVLLKSKLSNALYLSLAQLVVQGVAVILLFIPYQIPVEGPEETEIQAD